MKKILVIIIAALAVLFAALIIARNIIAKTAITAGVKAITGLEMKIEEFNVGILGTQIGLKGLKLFNPPGFVDELMVDMPEIYVDYDLRAFLKKEIHLEEVRLRLRELVVVKNWQGGVNLDSLKAVQVKKGEKAPEEQKEKAKMPEFQIDVLKLKVGKVVYKDYSQGSPPQVKEFNLNIDERFENITDPHSLARLIIVKALMKTTISRLAGFDVGLLTEGAAATLEKATGLTIDTFGMTKDAAGDAAKKAVDIIKQILPLGK